jgi:hypothetical protein
MQEPDVTQSIATVLSHTEHGNERRVLKVGVSKGASNNYVQEFLDSPRSVRVKPAEFILGRALRG